MKTVILMLCVSLICMEAVFFAIGAGHAAMTILAILGAMVIVGVAIASSQKQIDEVIHSSADGSPLVRTIRDGSGKLMIRIDEDGREVSIELEEAEAKAHALMAAVARVKSET